MRLKKQAESELQNISTQYLPSKKTEKEESEKK